MYTPPPLTFERIPDSAMFIVRFNGVEVGHVYKERSGRWLAYKKDSTTPLAHQPRGLQYKRFSKQEYAGMELVHEANLSPQLAD